MFADIIIKNGKCITMESEYQAQWIAVKDRFILDVGEGEAYQAYVSPDTVFIDAEGCSVLPGFIDSHFHVIQTALNTVSLNLSDVETFSQIDARIREAAVFIQAR